MKAKEFLADKTLQAVDVVGNRIITIVADNLSYGLLVKVDDLKVGTSVQRCTEFSVTNDVLTVGDITLDLAATEML
jgi:hypothetical protein